MTYLFGVDTKTIVLKSESHKLFHQFEVEASQAVKKGQPVVITDDEQVQPAGTTSTTQQIIGFSMHDGDEGELVTVMMKAYAILFVQVETASLAAGPVRLGTTGVYDAGTGYVLIDDATVDHNDQLGWALEGGGVGDIVRCALL